MAITISGSGTITGISAGGLPSGTVTSATLASGVGGKVLQVVESSSNTTVTTSSGSNEELDLLTVSITPSSTSNKVLIFVTFVGQANQNTNSKAWIRLYRGTSSGTKILDLKQGSSDGGGTDSLTMTGSRLDSPSTTSAQTYTMTLARLSSGTNTVSSDGNTYYLQAVEVAA
tara:strand:- start:32 stop:547 length:516 start_codon:yes stop_codon:yes gene_type:complete